MWWDDIERLLTYAVNRYPEPNIHWTKRKFELRCYEMLAYENAITACMDRPLEEPNDILEEYLIYLEWCIAYFIKREKRREEYDSMKCVVMSLINKLN